MRPHQRSWPLIVARHVQPLSSWLTLRRAVIAGKALGGVIWALDYVRPTGLGLRGGLSAGAR